MFDKAMSWQRDGMRVSVENASRLTSSEAVSCSRRCLAGVVHTKRKGVLKAVQHSSREYSRGESFSLKSSKRIRSSRPLRYIFCRATDPVEDEISVEVSENVYDGEKSEAENSNGYLNSTERDLKLAEAVGFQLQKSYNTLNEKWSNTSPRYQIVISMALAFVVCNMDKVNISIAIIPMASDFGWKPTTAGFIQSAFFYGYLLAQIPGGWLANKYGGQRVLPFGVVLWSLATAAVPFIAGNIGALSIARAAVGLGEGLSPPAAADVIARLVPINERSRATALVFGGLNLGTVLGLTLAPSLIDTLGWPSVFIIFGLVGVFWCVWFDAVIPQDTDKIEIKEEAVESPGVESPGDKKIPWGKFVTYKPIQALTYVHFCNNWAVYTILAWLPSFYKDSLDIDLQGASHLALLPPVAAILVSAIAAPLADTLIGNGMNVTKVRKLMQTIAFVSPTICMLLCIQTSDSTLSTWLLALGLGLQTFSLAGLYCNHQDISKEYASVLLSMTNVFGSLSGVLGVPLTGWMLDRTDSWVLSLFVPCLFFYISGAAVYAKFGSAEPMPLGIGEPVPADDKDLLS